jgi:uncharacterized protein YbcI
MGRGPDEARALVARDLVVVRLKGVFTPAERQLANILTLFTNIDVQIGERVFVFTVDRELQSGSR